jgi:hypothetical protein
MKLNWSLVGCGLLLVGIASDARADTLAKATFYTDFEHHLFGSDGTIATQKVNMAFTKRLTLRINDGVNPVSEMSDPDSPTRKYHVGVRAEIDIKDTQARGPWRTGDERCDRISFDVLWHESEDYLTTKDLLSSGVDSRTNWNVHYLCHGFKLKIPSVRKLMIPGSEQEVSLYVRGIEAPIAKGILVTEKAPLPRPTPSEDPHSQD